ncbi:hypothetical protein BYT27DRAFT_6755542 [Phlegmacium glaucopus]|nr:hypothetical protein BYT27DRAFT_6755542 [Phlegmacium glaucopus]
MSSEKPSKNKRIIEGARSIKKKIGSLLQPPRPPSPPLIDVDSRSDNHVAATSTVAGTSNVPFDYLSSLPVPMVSIIRPPDTTLATADTDSMSPPIAVAPSMPDVPRQLGSISNSKPETPPNLSDHMVATSTAARTSSMPFDHPPSFPVSIVHASDTTVASTATDPMSPPNSIPVTIPDMPRQFGSVGSSRPETTPMHLSPLNANSPMSLFQNAQINMNQPTFIVATNVYQVSDGNGNEQPKARILDALSEKLMPRAQFVEYNAASPVPRNACRKDTREAILDTLQVWANDKTTTMVYWLSGMAGTGKTTIAYSFSEILRAKKSLGGTFFSSHLRGDTRNVRCIIPTISLQLARFLPSMSHLILDVVEANPDCSAWRINKQFLNFIVTPLTTAYRDSREVVAVIVLDALDECSDHSLVAELLAVILEHSTSLPVKFFITSRPDTVFKEYFDQSQAHSSSILHDYINPTPSSAQSTGMLCLPFSGSLT